MIGDKLLNKGMEKKYRNQHITNYEIYLDEYDENWEKRWEDEFIHLERIKNITEKYNASFFIVSATTVEQVYEEDWNRIKETYPELKKYKYDMDKPNNILKNFSKNKELYYIDLLPYFKNNSDRLHWQYDGHWNDKGNVFAAEIIYRNIENLSEMP